jgi:hypothetical protein
MKKETMLPEHISPTPEATAGLILRELHALADPGRAAGAQRFFREPIAALGVDAPTLRRCAKGWVFRLRPVWDLTQAEALCTRLLAEPHLEARCAGFLVLDHAYALAQDRLGEREDLMHKALGWLPREAGKTDPKRLQAFLLRHGPSLPRTSLRYAIERFPETERQRLLKATRS